MTVVKGENSRCWNMWKVDKRGTEGSIKLANYTVSHKKNGANLVLSVTWSNINRF